MSTEGLARAPRGALPTDPATIAAAFAGTPLYVALYDADDRLTWSSPLFRETFLKGHAGPIAFPDILRHGFAHGIGVKIDRGAIEPFLADILPRRRAMQTTRAVEVDTVDGRWIWMTETRLPDGGMLCVGSDITRLKHSEKTLRQAHELASAQARELTRSNAELEQFAYVASHDLQEPLRTVASYTQLLLRKRDIPAERAGEYGRFILDGVGRMQRLIADLLTYSRVSGGAAAPVPVALDDALKQALANLDGALQASGGQVTHTPLPTLAADPSQMTQLFQNLIGNALKFAGPLPPRINVGARRTGDEWTIAVKDNGIGIEPRHIDKLFTIFQRLHSRERYEGTGIGLAICRKIVSRHGGRIWVESTGPGQGATFYFTLPATPG